ncbi:hypothetical protein [Streptomyces sp. NPDC049881]|uniref:hypothetical protein n=1 Tax=Streptomyces sp. NPDC049881 TaxID=3155778 RepID=UPI00343345A3
MGTSEDENSVSIHLTDCGRDTARAVFDVLTAAYPGSAPGTGPEGNGGGTRAGHPVVWSMVVATEAYRPGVTEEAPALDETVNVTVTGSSDGVARVGEVLGAAFRADQVGRVPGEHEFEVRLRLSR